MKAQAKFTFYFQLLIWSNLFPIFCIYKYNWSFFEVLWLYWMEALIIIVFDMSKLIVAQINTKHENFTTEKVKMAIVLFLIRFFMLLFYLLFMFVFIAIGNKDSFLGSVKTIIFQNSVFNYAFLSFFIIQYYYYCFSYIGNKIYTTKTPEAYYSFFNASTIVLHIVIVLGVVCNAYFNSDNKLDSNAVFLVIFIISKTIASLIQYWLADTKESQTTTHYI